MVSYIHHSNFFLFIEKNSIILERNQNPVFNLHYDENYDKVKSSWNREHYTSFVLHFIVRIKQRVCRSVKNNTSRITTPRKLVK